MKKNLLLLLSLLGCSGLFAQLTITSSDMPNTGDTIRYSITTDVNDYTTTDTNFVWDYSSLNPSGQDIYEFKSALSINPAYVLSFGFFAYGVKLADSLGAGPIMFKNIYNFYKKTSSKYTIEGYGAEFTGIPIPATYSDADEVYQFPLSYGRMDTSTFDVTISVPTVLDIRQKGTRYNEVDGWGTIITPYGTFNAIRIKSFVDEVDTISSSFFPTPFAIPRTTTTYKWLTNGEKIPLLEVQGTETGGTFTPTQIRYRDTYRYIAPLIIPVADFVADKTVCNLTDIVNFTNNTAPSFGTSLYHWTASPSTVTFVSGTSANASDPSMQFGAYGLYTISLKATIPGIFGAAPGIDSTEKVNYILVRDNTGIQSIDASQVFKVYPNPTTNSLYIDHSNFTNEIKTIEIFTTSGQVVLKAQSKNAMLDVSELAVGQYTIVLTDSKQKQYYSSFQKN